MESEMSEVKAPPVHPPLPLGLGSYVTLTGVSGAVAAFVIAWVQAGELTPAVAALGVTAGVAVVGWFAGRSVQAKAAIEQAGKRLGEVGIAFSELPATEPAADQSHQDAVDLPDDQVMQG
jgi:hypothetical protein